MILSATPADAAPLLSCEGLAVGYKEKIILSEVHLSFPAAQFVSLLGPNGAGKTTLLRTLSRHLQPLAGVIRLGERSLQSLRQAELARNMAVVLTEKVTPPLFTAFQFAALGRYPHTDFLGRLTKKDEEVVYRSLAAVHAEELGPREFASLSDGERQKVLMARALAQEPRILLLDEPTAHLDLKHRVEVMSILRSLCAEQGITVVASLHDVDIAAKVSDTVVLVKNGGIMQCGSPEELLETNVVAELYDFEAATFSRQLGSIELRGEANRDTVFVVGGMGCGTTVFRVLAKKGYRLRTGVLFHNDLDYFVAQSLQIPCTSQHPAAEISADSLIEATKQLKGCDWVIDAGFDASSVYRNNLQLLSTALALAKPVLSLGQREREHGTGASWERLVRLQHVGELSTVMEGKQ